MPSVSGGMDYRADELDHMLATNRIKDWCSQRRIVVIIPEAVRAPAPESALAKAGESLLKRLGEAVLKQDVGFFARYAALRDALNAYEGDMARVGHDPGHPDAPQVGDLVQAMADSIPGIPEDVGREMESTVKRALGAIERLDARAFAQMHIPA